MINMTVEITTMKEFEVYRQKGYTERITDVAIMLGVRSTKAEKLLRAVPNVRVSKAISHRLEHKESSAATDFYNPYQVIKCLFNRDLIRGYMYDPESSYIDKYGIHIYRNGEIEIDKSYWLSQMSSTHILLSSSKSVKDIVYEDKGYWGYTYSEDGKTVLFMNEDEEIKTSKELITKSEEIQYTRKIQDNFYIKFVVGERGKRGNKKYFQSIRTHQIKGLNDIIDRWMKDYKDRHIE